MMRALRLVTLIGLCVLLPVTLVASGKRQQLTVTAAFADQHHITIVGGNFLGKGHGQLRVMLAREALWVVSATPTVIVAELPEGLEPGSYELLVSRGPARRQSDVFEVAIGTAGPEGPAGSGGPPGEPGLPGPMGPRG